MSLTTPSPRSLRILGGSAFLLALLALLAGSPSDTRVTMDLEELAVMIEQEADHVEPGELASLLMDSTMEFRLVDIRDSASFSAYHIPGAERWDLSSLVRSSIDPRAMIILYSDGGTHASQAWLLLKARGFRNAFTLKGGLDLWKDQVLHPQLSDGTPPIVRDSLSRLAAYFGGSIAGSTSTPPPSARRPLPNPPVKFERERERVRDGC